MRLKQRDTVVQVTFMPRLFPINCYLVKEEDGLTLIDAAMPFCWKGILQAAEMIGEPIVRIVLTHAHADHVGALDRLRSMLPDVPIYISNRDARLLHGDLALEAGETGSPLKGSFNRKLRTRADHMIADGDRIGSLTAVAAPGHTPGHMAFFDERYSILIAGDAFQTRGGIAVAGSVRPTFPFPAWGTWDREHAQESARRLCLLQPKLLAVGHGEMVDDPVAEMDRAIAAAARGR